VTTTDAVNFTDPSAVADPPQYSWKRIGGVWALAAAPMALAAWALAPTLARQWDDGLGLLRGLVIALTLGLVWQATLVVILLRKEGVRTFADARTALWLVRPQGPRTGRVGGKVWLMLLPAAVVLIALQAIPPLPGIEDRDLFAVLQSDAGAEFFLGNWGWFALVFVMLLLNTAVGEELLFRGVLLPRMQRVGGRFAWGWNSALFAAYHVHQPWTILNVLVSSTVFTYTTQRYRSAWMGVILHSLQSVVATALLLGLVLGVA
jgi:membrane protease YdiL (CAAX protease family)